MKTFRYLSFAIIAAFAAASCAKELPVQMEESSDGAPFQLEVSLPESGEAKTQMGAKTNSTYPLTWQSGDVIYVNGVASNALSASAAGKASAIFTFPKMVYAPYNVTYAAVKGSADLVEIPTTQVTSVPQDYTSGYVASFKQNVEPMYASSADNGNLSFKHLGCVVRIPLKADTDGRRIRTITLTAADGSSLAGVYRIGKSSSGLLNGSLKAVSGTNTVNLVCTTGYTSLSTDAAVPYVCVIAPGKYPAGINVTALASNGDVMNFNILPGATLAAGTVYEVGTTTFKKNGEFDIVITNEAQLKSFRENLNSKKYLSAVLGKDIEITDASTWSTPLDGFTGYLDGAGHKISGLKCPMFNELKGTVRNLTLNSTISQTLPDKDTLWTGIIARRMYWDAVISNCKATGSLKVTVGSAASGSVHIGGLVGYMPRGLVKGCTNEAAVTVTGNNTAVDLNVGGIVGYVYAGEAVIDLYGNNNAGNVTVSGTQKTAKVAGVIAFFNPKTSESVNSRNINTGVITSNATPTGDHYVAGVCAQASTPISGCSNEGDVIINGTQSGLVYIGGVVARIYQTNASDCINNGHVLVSSGCSLGTVSSCIGGVVGYATNTNYTLSNLRNNGTVEYQGTSTKSQNMGGVVGYSQNALTGLVNNGTVLMKNGVMSEPRCGGVVGAVHKNIASIKDCSSSENSKVILDGAGASTTAGAAVSGVLAYCENMNITLSNLSSKGLIHLKNYNPSTNGRMDLGGIVGLSRTSTGITFSSCSNSGTIKIDGGLAKNTSSNIASIGGLGGFINKNTDAAGSIAVNNCSFTGDIIYNSASDAAGYICIGGLVAQPCAATYSQTASYSSGRIQVNGHAKQMEIGGNIGRFNYTKAAQTATITGEQGKATSNTAITVNETGAPIEKLYAGGIVGSTISVSGFTLTLNMSNCSNKADLERRTAVPGTDTDSYAGGIVGGLGLSSGNFVNATLTGCSNSGKIRFNQVSGTDSDDKGEGDDNTSYTGGIAGYASAATGCQIKIVSCSNSGNIYSTCGRHGGILGVLKSNTTITGTKTAYTVNTGRLLTRSDTEWNEGPSPLYTYSGGIVGQIQITGKSASGDFATIEYCHNAGSVYGRFVGGIVGALHSADAGRTTLRYCKNSGMIQVGRGRDAHRGALIGRFANAAKSISDCAIGGSYVVHGSTGTNTATKATSSNWYQYAANADGTPLFATAQSAQSANVLYWDGTSKTAWE